MLGREKDFLDSLKISVVSKGRISSLIKYTSLPTTILYIVKSIFRSKSKQIRILTRIDVVYRSLFSWEG